MSLDLDAARRAMGSLAESLGLSVEETALGIIRVVNANMVKGIAAVTILRGIDVRNFSLLSFGGAGGVHAVDLAQSLSMREALIPPLPGTFSAVGLLVTEGRHDYVTALGGIRTGNLDLEQLEAHYVRMEREALDELTGQGFAASAISLIRTADLKVSGQTYELSLPFSGSGKLDARAVDDLIEAFSRLYRERYAFFFEGEPIEIVNLRVAALGKNAPVSFEHPSAGKADPVSARKGQRPVYFEKRGFVDTVIFERTMLKPGNVIKGPAIVEEATSSVLIPPDTEASVLDDLGLAVLLDKSGEAK